MPSDFETQLNIIKDYLDQPQNKALDKQKGDAVSTAIKMIMSANDLSLPQKIATYGILTRLMTDQRALIFEALADKGTRNGKQKIVDFLSLLDDAVTQPASPAKTPPTNAA
jgi:hypothetical protein